MLSQILVQRLNRNPIPRPGERGFSLGELSQRRGQRTLRGGSVGSVPPASLIPPLSPGTSSEAARSLQGLPSLFARTAEQRCLCVYRFCTARRGRAEGERAVLNLPGTRIGPGRREKSSRRGRESPRSRERCPGPRGAALPPLAKGSAPWGLTIRGRIGLETALCFLLLQRLCSAARAGRGALGHGSQTSGGTGERPKVRDPKGVGAALNCPPVKPHLVLWKTYF